MADYTELKGLKVKYLDSDPSPGTAGDVWYNTDSKQLKAFVASSAWHSSAPLITGRTKLCGSGTQTAAFAAGGLKPSAANETEEFTGETTALNLKTITDS